MEARLRFDQSFVIRMIRDFLVALIIIIAVELGARLVLTMYRFDHQDREATQLAADRLAADVKNIMLNQGGPVATRTVYPILRRNHNDLGFEIAIEPSDLTTDAIRQRFGVEARGIPAAWPDENNFHEASITLEADSFCLTCHFTAQLGDALGTVTVRSYRSTRMAEWWREARVLSVVGMANIILHTIVLFLLLRIRMEPLMQLSKTVARLAKGRIDLSQRATPRSSDEFGELAVDLNHFLDRVSHVVDDLDDVLRKAAVVNERLSGVSNTMGNHIESVQAKVHTAMTDTVSIQLDMAGPTDDAIQSLDLALTALDNQGNGRGISAELSQRLREVITRLKESAHITQSSTQRMGDLRGTLWSLTKELKDDSHYVGEILLLEERMKVVSESGQVLLKRLKGE